MNNHTHIDIGFNYINMDLFYEMLDKTKWLVWGTWRNTTHKTVHDMVIMLKHDQEDVYIYDELSQTNKCIHPGDFLRGIVESKIGCMHILIHISKNIRVDIRDFNLSRDIELVRSNHVSIIRSYLPSRDKCIKLYLMTNTIKKLKKELINELEYHPKYGVKYFEYISDLEFQKRWNRI